MRTIEELEAIILSDNPYRFYKLTDWLSIRIEVLKRDHYECQRCNGRWKSDFPVRKVKLTKAKYVHHIKPLLKYPRLCIDYDNLVSLCFQCHEIIEQRNITTSKKEPLTKEKW